jgi:YHYH protein
MGDQKIMSKKTLYGTAAASVVLAAASLIYSPSSAQNVKQPNDTAAVVEAANWADHVTITVDADAKTFRFQSNGIPDHGFAEQYLIPSNPNDQPFADKPLEFFDVQNSADYFKETEVDATITTQPVYSDTSTDTSLGRIGVALSGAQIFNDYENPDRSVVAIDDQVVHDHVAFLDNCNGHTLVDGTNYHYHGIPVCIAEAAAQAGQHSRMIGVLADGFPVYGNNDVGGIVVVNDDLDACSGHSGPTPEFPEGIYHYHLTADEAPYMIDCYHGEVDVAANNGPGGGGAAPDFAAVADQLGITEAELVGALGDTRPPDFAAAAQALGVSEADLRAAMPAPGQ